MKLWTALIFGLAVLPVNSFALDTPAKAANGGTEEMVLSREEMKKYASTYRDPYVRHIRRAISNCLKAKYEGDDNCKAIRAIDLGYLKNKFVVYSYEDHLFGGHTIEILSQKKPDKIFVIWVYKGEGGYELRTIHVKDLTNEQVQEIRMLYGRYLKDEKLAF